MVRASGRVPQISVVLGAAAGGAAYGPALTDIVIMAPDGRVFVTGPDVVKSVTGEQVDMEALGGPSAHGRKSGVVHIVADSEADALRRARKVASLFSRPGIAGFANMTDDPDWTKQAARAAQPRLQRPAADRRHPRRADGRAAGQVGAEHRGRPRPARWPVGRRGREQPAAAGRLPGFDVGREGVAVRPDVRRVRHPAAGDRRRARLPARVSARSGTAWSGAARSCCTPSPRRWSRG